MKVKRQLLIVKSSSRLIIGERHGVNDAEPAMPGFRQPSFRSKKMRNLNPFHSARRLCLGAATIVFVLLSAACAVTPAAPTASLSAARQAITSAERSDAQQYAGTDLNDARRRLQLAEQAVRNKNMIEAERLADESKVAAELASATTEMSKALESNLELRRAVEALVDETRRTGGQQ